MTTNTDIKVLLVDDEPQILLSYEAMLNTDGILNVISLDDSRKVMQILREQDISVTVLDITMPNISGIEILERINQEFDSIPVIVATASNDIDIAVECMKKGAVDYIVKPVEHSRFISSVRKAAEISTLRDEVTSLRHHIASLRSRMHTEKLANESAFAAILTANSRVRDLFHYIEPVSKSSEPLLITGETGVGKELFSYAVHDSSGISGEFVAVNVAGLDDTMFSDTLFGHRKGAFTGADDEREGLIVRASGGSLFLDEIGDLSESSQVKLLRLIEDRLYYPLGSDTAVKSSARVIASTNRDLGKLIKKNKFRKDLYYRLASIQVHVPPLRERKEDIPVLLDHFLSMSAESLGKKVPAVPKELLSLLESYHFPGNIREMKAMVFDAVARHESGVMSMNYFREFIQKRGQKSLGEPLSVGSKSAGNLIDLSGRFPTIREVSDYLVDEAMKRSDGNQGIAASLLGITRQALNRRLRKKDV